MSETKRAAQPDYRHTYRLFGLIIVALGVAVLGRCLLLPPTFGQYGHFRGAAVKAARSRPVRHVGVESCAKCHPRRVKLRYKDAHGKVQCETCHGPGAAHKTWHEANKGKGKKSEPATAKMRVRRNNTWCLVCHRQLAARPGSFPQINPVEHFRLVGVADPKLSCRTCHNPHEPLHTAKDLHKARKHPMPQRCRDCHTGKLRYEDTLPANVSHPSIFSCGFCHKRKAALKAKLTHKKLKCERCHHFFRESARTGRMARHGGTGFCLLCHKAGKWRPKEGAPGARPTITWPEHREEMGDEEDKDKVCVDCHRTNIHYEEGEKPGSDGDANTPASGPALPKKAGDGKKAEDLKKAGGGKKATTDTEPGASKTKRATGEK